MSHKTLISVVIPCRNEEHFIEKCVLSVLNQTNDSLEVEVIVCDGLSSDNTSEIVKKITLHHKNVKWLENKEIFTPQALNLGISYAKGEYIVIFGAHAFMHENYLKESLVSFSISPDIACVGGVITNIYQNNNSKCIGLAMSSSFGVGNAHFRTGNKSGYVDTVAFGMYKKAIFKQIGGFDEKLVRNQDDEFNYRIHKHGMKVYLNSRVNSSYFVRSSWPKLYRQYYQYGYWKVYVNIMHKVITTLRQLIPLLFVLFLISFPLFVSLNLIVVWASIVGFYLILSLLFAHKQSEKIVEIPKISFTFFTLHLAYGLGYLVGIIQLILFKKKIASNTRIKQSSR